MNEISGMEQFEGLFGFSTILSLFSAVPGMLIGLAVYIATAYGLYTIAKRRGISKPWLAWIPVVSVWILGAISDHYCAVVTCQKKSRRKILLGTAIAASLLGMILVAICLGVVIDLLIALQPGMMEIPENIMLRAGSVAVAALLVLPTMVVAIVHAIFYYIALYDVYRSCEPSNAVLYLVLSILISYCQPVFLVLCRNKDDGMPAPQSPIPGAPAEPWTQNQE